VEQDGTNAISFAAHGGSLKAVKWLVGMGLDVNAVSHLGLTVFHFAAMRDSLEVMEWLVDEAGE
jgi:ankyrin repeat protein